MSECRGPRAALNGVRHVKRKKKMRRMYESRSSKKEMDQKRHTRTHTHSRTHTHRHTLRHVTSASTNPDPRFRTVTNRQPPRPQRVVDAFRERKSMKLSRNHRPRMATPHFDRSGSIYGHISPKMFRWKRNRPSRLKQNTDGVFISTI